MKKKRSPGFRLTVSDPRPQNAALNWPNVPERDLFLYARSFHKAAKTLAASLQLDANALGDSDVSPGRLSQPEVRAGFECGCWCLGAVNHERDRASFRGNGAAEYPRGIVVPRESCRRHWTLVCCVESVQQTQ